MLENETDDEAAAAVEGLRSPDAGAANYENGFDGATLNESLVLEAKEKVLAPTGNVTVVALEELETAGANICAALVGDVPGALAANGLAAPVALNGATVKGLLNAFCEAIVPLAG